MKKTLSTMILMLFMALTPVSADLDNQTESTDNDYTMFQDISENDLEIIYLQKNNVINGKQEGLFQPDNLINRAEMMKIILTALGIEPDSAIYQNCFPDVKTSWYAPYVCFAKEQNLISGYPDGLYKPYDKVNFAEALKITLNTFQVNTGEEGPSWHSKYINTANSFNLLNKYLDKSQEITRKDMAIIATRAAITKQTAQKFTTEHLVNSLNLNIGIESILTQETDEEINEEIRYAIINGLPEENTDEDETEGIEEENEDDYASAPEEYIPAKIELNKENRPTTDYDQAIADYDTQQLDQAIVNNSIDEMLIAAAYHDQPDSITYLLIKGANINYQDSENGMTALHWAAAMGNIAAMENLMKRAANINNNDNPNKLTPLHLAIIEQQPAAVDLLTVKKDRNITREVDFNAEDINGYTPLMFAIINNDLTIAANLLERGADINHINQNNQTVLCALMEKHTLSYDQVKFILDQGININSTCEQGKTPLHIFGVAEKNIDNYRIALFLLENGADVHARDDLGWTPLHRAVENNNYELAEQIILNQADIEATVLYGEFAGMSALDIARLYCFQEIDKLLVSHEGKIANPRIGNCSN